MELRDTVKDVLSEDRIKSLESEYNQLAIHGEKLSQYIYAVEHGEEEPPKQYGIDLLKVQESAMIQYAEILLNRIKLEKGSEDNVEILQTGLLSMDTKDFAVSI